MLLTFKQTLDRISGGKEYKNDTYHMSRVRKLIKAGELTEGHADELFIKNESGEFISIGSVKTEPLVTAESVNDYVSRRQSEISERGCVTKGGKPVRAIFSDGSETEFGTMGDVVNFFGITRYQLRQAIATNRPIEYIVNKKRADELDVDHESEMTEHIRFKYS